MTETHILPQLDIPRPEHPRPDFERETWLNLNGKWRFTFDPQNMGEQKRWHHRPHPDTRKRDAPPLLDDPFTGEIVVPFPWESPLSGIGNTDYRGAGWYQCSLTMPAEWAGSPWLCFGAVDWCARVWVNGRFIGEHFGGYTPFAIDLSGHAAPSVPVTLTVRVWDNCDADTLLGKQTYDWYTPSSGIWQTVWLEDRPYKYIENFQVTTNITDGTATFAVDVSGVPNVPYTVRVSSPDSAFETAVVEASEPASVTLKVTVANPELWTPEHPKLYDALVTLTSENETDTISTYFGLRNVGRAAINGNSYEYFLLNDMPIYLRGALDQAFTPQGLHTYPTDDAIRADIQLAKDLGLNMLRCHIKLNEPRYYYWADKLGMTIWYDIPCASIYTGTARKNWQEAFEGAVKRDFNHPSIIAWILFNETWGLEEHQNPESWRWVRDMYTLARGLDPTRLSEDNSACNYDHVKTDINTWHFYIADYERAKHHIETVVNSTYEGSTFNYVSSRQRVLATANEAAQEFKQGREPLLNSEYAGLGASGGDRDVSHTFQFLTTLQRRHAIICGYVYTELTDIEWEHNGFVNYDRTAKEFGYGSFVEGMTVADINGADFVGFDCAPIQTVTPGETVSCVPFVSHWDRERDLAGAQLAWQLDFVNRYGEKQSGVQSGHIAINPRRFDVHFTEAITVAMPQEVGVGTLALKLVTASGETVVRNFINFDVFDVRHELPEHEQNGNRHYLRFEPGDYVASSWAQPALGPRHGKFGSGGSGWVDYEVSLPDGLQAADVTNIKLIFEAGSRTAGRRLGWKRPWSHGSNNYPQTHADNKVASDLTVSVGGVALPTVSLPDDPADCRGTLTLQNGGDSFEFASYGFLTEVSADGDTARQAVAGAKAGVLTVRFEIPVTGKTNGLNLYGGRLGAYAVPPTLIISTE